ncbi:MAG: FecR domain-containing protein [Arcicella sp.]|jgi:ferric-dicitrate binding protein FerR (iron transport regulator)|nr:FecR domain-containing protein [Arcicella sp.]
MTALNKHILFEHFAGRTSPLQKKMIAEWLQTTDNQELYYKWLEEYENCFPQVITDKGVAKNSFFEKIRQVDFQQDVSAEIEEKPLHKFKINWFRWGIAAMMSLTFTSALYLKKEQLIYKNYQTAYGETQTIQLPDGSVVTLNANSTLRALRFGFEDAPIREVYLEGEAEFLVKHKANNQRFIVRTSQKLEVEVLGTEFSVFARQRGSKVVLTKGKVKVNYVTDRQKHTIMMKPGELIALDRKGTAELKEVKNIKVYTAWKSHRFIFDDTSLQEIILQIEENFGVRIEINDLSLANRRVTGTFIAEQADDLLAILQELLSLQYEKNTNGTIVLSQIPE